MINQTDRKRYYLAWIWKLTAVSALLVPILVSAAYGQAEIRAEKELKLANDQLERQAVQLAAQRTELEQKIGELQRQLETLKIAAAPPPEDAVVRVFSLAHVRPKDAASAIAPLLGGGKIRLSAIDEANILIVAGTEEQLSVAAHLIKEVDRPADKRDSNPVETLQLRFFWLAGGLPDSELPIASSVLDSQVVFAIQRLGLSDPRVLCQHVTSVAKVANSDAEFSFVTPALVGTNRFLFEGQGELAQNNPDQYQVSLSTRMRVGGGGETSPSWQMRGSVAMPLRHYVVMGTTNFVLESGDGKATSHPASLVLFVDQATTVAVGRGRSGGGRGGRIPSGAEGQRRSNPPAEDPFGK